MANADGPFFYWGGSGDHLKFRAINGSTYPKKPERMPLAASGIQSLRRPHHRGRPNNSGGTLPVSDSWFQNDCGRA